MSHDLRQAIGFRRLPASDPEEQKLRDQWYEAKNDADGKEASHPKVQYFNLLDRKMRDFMWAKALQVVAEDRAKHPRAKRNQLPDGPVPGKTRYLP